MKSKSVLSISEKYAICKKFESIAECGPDLYLLGGTAEISQNNLRPFLILASLDDSLNPISGNIIDVEEAKSISSVLVLEDENGFTVVAGAQNWIFVFKVVQT